MINDAVDEKLSAAVKQIPAGERTMTIMYLERGSSQSNCAFYFNLAPRFSLSIQKEDVLTRDVLNGAQFTVYEDAACTIPTALWTSQESHDRKDPSTSTFTVVDGVANIWGFASGHTYYIRETQKPTSSNYGISYGIIRLTIDKYGVATYDVEIVDEGSHGVSAGFTVHGIRIDEQTQSAYIVATNAPIWVEEVTTVQVYKQWQDKKDHSSDYITVYLTVEDSDGTVRRIREILLSAENNWYYEWTNLPKYAADKKTLIQYGVEEAYTPGYQAQVTKVDEIKLPGEYKFEDGHTYLLSTSNGYLASKTNADDTGYQWLKTEAEARNANHAQWTASVSANGTVRLTNKAGYIITFWYGNGSPTDFFAYKTAGESNDRKQYFTPDISDSGIRLYFDAPNGNDYYIASSWNNSQKFDNETDPAEAMVFVPVDLAGNEDTIPVTGWGYRIDNIPLTEETALTVTKVWDLSNGVKTEDYIQAQVTVRLLADSVDTGRTVTLNLKNGWTDSFQGLPYKDAAGKVISYTVEEVWHRDNWTVTVGPIVSSGGKIPTYSVTLTNTYSLGGPILPSTGSYARLMYILCGGGIMLASLVYGIGSRRKRERRMK